ncbi:MAG: hypothetical protein WKF76_06645 [Nocardioidaceae bacterium]
MLLLADWEWCTVGDRLTDVSWCEFIVRLHHPDHVAALPALWDGYGARPRWELRQQAMLARAEQHRAWAKTWRGVAGGADWRDRITLVQELAGGQRLTASLPHLNGWGAPSPRRIAIARTYAFARSRTSGPDRRADSPAY